MRSGSFRVVCHLQMVPDFEAYDVPDSSKLAVPHNVLVCQPSCIINSGGNTCVSLIGPLDFRATLCVLEPLRFPECPSMGPSA